jgi:hypothetical protein
MRLAMKGWRYKRLPSGSGTLLTAPDVVEIINPDGEGWSAYRFQIAPQGVIFSKVGGNTYRVLMQDGRALGCQCLDR